MYDLYHPGRLKSPPKHSPPSTYVHSTQVIEGRVGKRHPRLLNENECESEESPRKKGGGRFFFFFFVSNAHSLFFSLFSPST